MRSLAVAAVFLVGMAAASAHATGEFSHEGWSGKAMHQDGKFIQCWMSMSAINNYDLILALNATGEWRLGFRSSKIDLGWRALFGQKFAVRMQIDDSPVLTKAFEPKGNDRLTTSLNNTDWEKRLPTGKLLRINTGRVKLFHLDGIKQAMGMLRACVSKQQTA
jgi:hypothetical protein